MGSPKFTSTIVEGKIVYDYFIASSKFTSTIVVDKIVERLFGKSQKCSQKLSTIVENYSRSYSRRIYSRKIQEFSRKIRRL